MSQELIRKVDATQMVAISEKTPDFTTAQDRIYSGKAQGILYVPADFQTDIKKGKKVTVSIYLNTSKFLPSNDINKAINLVAEDLCSDIKLKYYEKQGASYQQATVLKEPAKYDLRPLFNFGETYGDFLIPGLLALILQQTLLIGLSESIAKEREENTMQNLYETSGKSIWAVITGKSGFYFVLFSAYAFLFYTVHFIVFKINFLGSAWALTLLTAIFLISVIYMSIFVSSFFKRKIISLQVFVFTSYPFFLISGYPWPYQQLPLPLKLLSKMLPSTPYLNAFQRITQMGAGLGDVTPELINLCILAGIGLIATRLRLKVLLTGK
jgi:ABC-2 type transport system permease protein